MKQESSNKVVPMYSGFVPCDFTDTIAVRKYIPGEDLSAISVPDWVTPEKDLGYIGYIGHFPELRFYIPRSYKNKFVFNPDIRVGKIG